MVEQVLDMGEALQAALGRVLDALDRVLAALDLGLAALDRVLEGR